MSELFEPTIDSSYFSDKISNVEVSPDRSRIAGVFTDKDGAWLLVGSFASGMRRIQIDVLPFFEYSVVTWIADSEVLYAHRDGLFAILDVDSGEEEVFGDNDGRVVAPIGEINGVLVGFVDRIEETPRFEIIGIVRATGETVSIGSLRIEEAHFGVNLCSTSSSVVVEDYCADAVSIAGAGLRRFTITNNSGDVCVEEDFRSVWNEASAAPFGFVNGFFVVRKGGLGEVRRFTEVDTISYEFGLYDWVSDEVVFFPFEEDFEGVVDEELLFLTELGEEHELPTLNRHGVVARVTDSGGVERIERFEGIKAGSCNRWGLVNGELYGYSHDTSSLVCYICNGGECEQYEVFASSDCDVKSQTTVVDTIDVEIASEYTAEVYAKDDVDLSSVGERPVVVVTYPSGSKNTFMRDSYALELVERGFLLVNVTCNDGTYYGSTLVLREIVEKLSEREYCSRIGLYGFSAGGTQVLNFVSSAAQDSVSCAFAGCPAVVIDWLVSHSNYMRPVSESSEEPLLYMEYSPLYSAGLIDIPTTVLFGRLDTRVGFGHKSEFEDRVTDNVRIVSHNIGHGANLYEDKQYVLGEIVRLFEEHLCDD